MTSSPARWKVQHLVVSWVAYWSALAVVTLAPAAAALWKVTRPDVKGNASLAFGDGAFKLTVSLGDATIWQGSAPLWAISLAIAGPPIALWIVWLLRVSAAKGASGERDIEQLGRGDELPFRHDDRQTTRPEPRTTPSTRRSGSK